MDRMYECTHKEILLARFIFRDDNNNIEFAVCKKCRNKFKRLKGFTWLEESHRKLETRAEKLKALKDIPF